MGTKKADCGCGNAKPGKRKGKTPDAAQNAYPVPAQELDLSALPQATERLEAVMEPPQVQAPHPEQGGRCLPWVRLVNEDHSRACLRWINEIGQISSAEKFYRVVREAGKQEDQECFYVLLLDTQLHVRGIVEVARGARDRVSIPIPDVFRPVLMSGATSFGVAHNHPSGKAAPSEADKELTLTIIEAAEQLNILFLDHIVVGRDEYYSFREHGKLKFKR
jgi:DNA repair protein RadC